jgi:hypothetical protein
MTILQGLGQKILEWVVIGALVGVIGYLIGNSDAMTMKAEIERLRENDTRQDREIIELEKLGARVERLDAQVEIERDMRRKGDER